MKKIMFGTILLFFSIVNLGYSEECYSIFISGCDVKAKICVESSSSSIATSKAVQTFKKTYSCKAAHVTSYSSKCIETEKDLCDIKL